MDVLILLLDDDVGMTLNGYLCQGWATLVMEDHCPTEFSFNPNETNLNKLIEVFRIARKLQAGDFFRVGAKLCSTVALKDRNAHP